MRNGLALLLNGVSDMEVVGVAPDGTEAINLVRRILPDVVLMDVSMPGMNGIQVTKILHSELPHIGIIGLSMYETEEQRNIMHAAGAVGYLTKTCPADAIIDAIRCCPPVTQR